MAAVSILVLLLCAAELGRGSVIRVGDSYYYDVTNMLIGRRFQVTPSHRYCRLAATLLYNYDGCVVPPPSWSSTVGARA